MTDQHTTTDPVRARREIFLRQTIAHSVGMVRDANATGAHADASVNAWWAYRLLVALVEATPDAPAIIADISAELRSGRAHRAAWEAALAVGIDPEALTAHMEAKFAARTENA